MYLKTQGLVLREVAYKDTDKLLTVLTRDYGKMTLKARGVRRSGSPLKASCQLLACGEFTIFEYRGMSTINEAQTVELFPELRTDLELQSGVRAVPERRGDFCGRHTWHFGGDAPRRCLPGLQAVFLLPGGGDASGLWQPDRAVPLHPTGTGIFYFGFL